MRQKISVVLEYAEKTDPEGVRMAFEALRMDLARKRAASTGTDSAVPAGKGRS